LKHAELGAQTNHTKGFAERNALAWRCSQVIPSDWCTGDGMIRKHKYDCDQDGFADVTCEWEIGAAGRYKYVTGGSGLGVGSKLGATAGGTYVWVRPSRVKYSAVAGSNLGAGCGAATDITTGGIRWEWQASLHSERSLEQICGQPETSVVKYNVVSMPAFMPVPSQKSVEDAWNSLQWRQNREAFEQTWCSENETGSLTMVGAVLREVFDCDGDNIADATCEVGHNVARKAGYDLRPAQPQSM
jgi:hypothetical protein